MANIWAVNWDLVPPFTTLIIETQQCCFRFVSPPGEEHNFLKLSSSEIDSRSEPYDYGSIMHYGESTFAKEVSSVTILPKKHSRTKLIPEIGQREHLSPGDIWQTSKMYRCPGMCRAIFKVDLNRFLSLKLWCYFVGFIRHFAVLQR